MVVADWEVRLESTFEAETNKKGNERTVFQQVYGHLYLVLH